jgi:hypothetical protein
MKKLVMNSFNFVIVERSIKKGCCLSFMGPVEGVLGKDV